jgi:hypothetical protein
MRPYLRSVASLLLSTTAACSAPSPDVTPEIASAPRRDQTATPDAAAPPTSQDPDPSGADPNDAGAATSTPPSNASGCDGLAVCDDFESSTVAATWTTVTPNCSGTGAIALDTSQAHSGSRSLKVSGGGGYCNHVFLSTTAAASVGSVLWGRFFVRLDQALSDNHVTFVSMKNASDGKELRMGGQNRVLMWNRESDDATLPAMSPTGTAASTQLAAQSWHCVELRIDGKTGEIQTWVEGKEIAGLAVIGGPTPDIDEPWLRKTGWLPMPLDVKFGWESYGNQPMTLWFDDVALGARRIGCGS